MGGPVLAALRYTEAGWPVLPLCWPVRGCCGCGGGHGERDAGKAPLPSRGWPALRADAARVRGWWQRWPAANVGILLEPAGLLVVDLDGPGALAEAESLGCPPTCTVRRGPDHVHLYYRRPPGCPAARRTRQGDSGRIDLLAAGYVVAPPSRHASGEAYVCRRAGPLAAAPAWAVAWLRGAAAAAPAPVRPAADAARALAAARGLLRGTRLAPVLEAGPGGRPGRYPSRSEALAAVEAALLRRGMGEAEVAAALLLLPWAAGMRRRPERWLCADVARVAARCRAAGGGGGAR